ncbi:MAG: hypothetical protein WCO75_04645 [Planctomycetota bacterium]
MTERPDLNGGKPCADGQFVGTLSFENGGHRRRDACGLDLF